MNQPWLPAFLNEPIPALRLVVLRFGVALLMLADITLLYLCDYNALLGTHGYTNAHVSDIHFQSHRAIWSVLRMLPESAWPVVFAAWLTASLMLLTGFYPRLAVLTAWVCATSVLYANPLMHSGGDRLRSILLFTLLLSPLPSLSQARDGATVTGWPARFLLFQLALMYFFAGIYKLRNPAWQDGSAMAFILQNGTWCLTPQLFNAAWLKSIHFFEIASYGTLLWEISFPILVYFPWTRWRVGLSIGVLFHLLCIVTLQVSTFPWYSLACYLPLVPWEKWQRKIPA